MRLNDDGKTVRAMDALVPASARSSAARQREERLEKMLLDKPAGRTGTETGNLLVVPQLDGATAPCRTRASGWVSSAP